MVPTLIALSLLACGDDTATSDSGTSPTADSGTTAGDSGGTTDCVELAWYADADDDGYGESGSEPQWACDDPGDWWVGNDRDCNDDDPSSFPGAADASCDDVDQDCDGQVDEDARGATSLWLDFDGDGFGDPDEEIASCSGGEPGYVDNDKDCDDSEATVNPDKAEVCNDGLDNDCSGEAEVCRLSGDRGVTDGDLLLEGPEQYAFIGGAFDPVGDLDADGYDDFVVGGRGDPFYYSNTLAYGAFVVFGPPDPNVPLQDHLHIEPGRSDFYVGVASAPVGDLDGDGFDDLVLGSPGQLWYEGEVGAVFFHSGSPVPGTSIDSCCAALIGDGLDWGSTGMRLDGGSDFSGDGLPDVAVGAPMHDPRMTYTNDGLVVLVSGLVTTDRALDSGKDTILRPVEGSNGWFGQAIADLGDTDGDGMADLLVGAGFDYSNNGRGQVYLFHGPIEGERSAEDADAIFEGPYEWQQLGQSVAAAGDANGDGYRDMLLGGYGAVSSTNYYEGSVLVVHGPVDAANPFSTKSATIRGTEQYGYLGWDVDGDFDADGDGSPDLLIGAIYLDQPGSTVPDAGGGLLFHGPLSGSYSEADADLGVWGTSDWATAGLRVAGLGDIDGDGLDDIGVGSPANNASSGSANYYGAVGVFLGSGL